MELSNLPLEALEKVALGNVNSDVVINLVVTVGEFIYKAVTEPSPIEDKAPSFPTLAINANSKNYKDKTSYTDLCRLRRNLSGSIPKEWVLDGHGRPTLQTNFLDNEKNVRETLNGLNSSDYPQKSIVIGLLARIGYIFQSLNERKGNFRWIKQWKNYRPDGFEVMFFSDLVLWLSVSLPRYDVKKQHTAEIVARWIAYCEAVRTDVLRYRDHPPEYYDPKDRLIPIINDLKRLHENIKKANLACTFNDRIRSIDLAILDITRHSINFFYVLLRGAHRSECLVDIFLDNSRDNPGENREPQTKILTELMMGQWLITTLRKAGILRNDYHNEESVDIHSISHHLVVDFEKISNLPATGLWEFAQEDKTQALSFLRDLVELHRQFLLVRCVRDTILLSSRVSEDWGRSWLYGENGGRNEIDKALGSVLHACLTYSNKLSTFWHKCYKPTFESYIKATGKDQGICYYRHQDAEACVAGITAGYQIIRGEIENIAEGIHNKEHTNETVRACLDSLRTKTEAYVSVTQAKLTSIYQIKPLESEPLPPYPKPPKYPGFFQSEVTAGVTSDESLVMDILWVQQRTHKVMGDGNCFFHAAVYGLQQQNIEKITHLEARQRTVDFVRLPGNAYLLAQSPPEDENMTNEQFLAEMAKPGTWIVEPFISAFALAFQVQLTIADIVTNNQGVTKVRCANINEEGPNLKGIIGFSRKNNNHYDALHLTKQPELVHLKSQAVVTAQEKLGIQNLAESAITVGLESTKVSFKQGELSLFEAVSRILGVSPIIDASLSILLDCVLINKPDTFYSKMQENIYLTFLLPNSTVVNWHWTLCVFQNISYYKIEKLIDLYQRINAVMKLIYIKEKTRSGAKCKEPNATEILLIDLMLHNIINAAFTKHNFYQYQLSWVEPEMKITCGERHIISEFDGLKFKFIRDDMRQLIDKSILNMDAKDLRIAELIKERDAAIEGKNSAIKDRNNIKNECDQLNVKINKYESLIEQFRQKSETHNNSGFTPTPTK